MCVVESVFVAETSRGLLGAWDLLSSGRKSSALNRNTSFLTENLRNSWKLPCKIYLKWVESLKGWSWESIFSFDQDSGVYGDVRERLFEQINLKRSLFQVERVRVVTIGKWSGRAGTLINVTVILITFSLFLHFQRKTVANGYVFFHYFLQFMCEAVFIKRRLRIISKFWLYPLILFLSIYKNIKKTNFGCQNSNLYIDHLEEESFAKIHLKFLIER